MKNNLKLYKITVVLTLENEWGKRAVMPATEYYGRYKSPEDAIAKTKYKYNLQNKVEGNDEYIYKFKIEEVQEEPKNIIHVVENKPSNNDTIYINNKPCDKFSMISLEGNVTTITKDTVLMFDKGSIHVSAIQSYRLKEEKDFSWTPTTYELYINDVLFQTFSDEYYDKALYAILTLDKIMKDLYGVVNYKTIK